MSKSRFLNIVLPLLLSLVMCLLVWSIGYQTPRENFTFFIAQYLGLFVTFYVLWLNKWQLKFSHFLFLAILVRLILLFSAPQLSNDFYRFIWDGELMTNGINPFAHTPNELISHSDFLGDQYKRILFHGMGDLSAAHYTCYPVLNQLIFFIPAYFSDSIVANVVFFKVVLLLADLGAIYFARKIAIHLGVSVHKIWLYALNPFVIIEFSGNIHFEGVMIFLLLASIYFVLKNSWITGGMFFGLAVHIKLIPLMLIPFVFKKMGWKISLGFSAMVAFTSLAVGGILLTPEFFGNMMQSVQEYFIRFQFNGSISALVSEIGFAINGWDPILTTGPILSSIATIGILTLAVFKAYRNDLDIFKGMMFALMIYYSMASTVHPWYLSMILVMAIFTQYKFALVWSIVVMLSYFAYSNPEFKASPVLQVAEYVCVYLVLFVEIWRNWRQPNEASPVGIQFKEFFKNKTN